jgi:hypothetical protein
VGFVAWVAVITQFALGHWMIFTLFVAHAILGSLELGTDSWIENINGSILTAKQGTILFIFASAMMFALRFSSHWIESRLKLSPIAILFTCSIFAIVGLLACSSVTTLTVAFGAVLIYSIGKTFFWPTMLAVVGDRFPRSGAVAMSIMGGIGMMSAGLLGSPGLGYAKDRFAGEELKKADPALHAEYKAATPSKFLVFSDAYGLDGKKLGDAKAALAAGTATEQQKKVHQADMRGDRRTLVADSFIPAIMAVIYLLLVLYFKAKGGYKPVQI